jgi:hypothetical protein
MRTTPPYRIHLDHLRLEHGEIVGEIRFVVGEPATDEQIEACVGELRAWLVARVTPGRKR